jgi:NADPH-dependent glutamate synthase beta subunit-like oxidoreductase
MIKRWEECDGGMRGQGSLYKGRKMVVSGLNTGQDCVKRVDVEYWHAASCSRTERENEMQIMQGRQMVREGETGENIRVRSW